MLAIAIAACADGTAPRSPNEFPQLPALGKGGNGGGGNGGTSAAPRIAYVRTEPGYEHGSIYTIASDSGQSSVPTPITIAMTDVSPAWSPDYRKIAFSRKEQNDERFIYVANASGTGPVKKIGPGYGPRWSPDGTKFAFYNFVEEGGTLNGDIYVMNTNGGSVTRLTTAAGTDGQPTWSPDGSRIAFNSYRTGSHEIFVMNADGTGQTKVTNCAIEDAACTSASWSPIAGDNRLIYRYDGTLLGSDFRAIRVINSNGTGLATVLITPGLNHPTWSPDGTRIAFSSLHGGRTFPDIFTIAADGTDLKQVTSGNKRDLYPAWSR
jgi:TolB protein